MENRSLIKNKKIIAIALGILFCVSIVAILRLKASTPAILVSSTESEPAHSTEAPRELIDAIFRNDKSDVGADDLEILQKCIHDLKIDVTSTHPLFLSSLLPRLNPNEEIYFVRPKLVPYCSAFYGAHVFRYWIVTRLRNDYRVRNAGIADEVRVLSSQHNDLFDLETTTCNTNACESKTREFHGDGYSEVR